MSRKPKANSRWRKRLLVSSIILFTLYLAFGFWGVPAILKSQLTSKGSEALGRAVLLEDASFNPLSFETRLMGLQISGSAESEDPLLRAGLISVNPQLRSVFGSIILKSVKLEKVDLFVEMQDGGRFSFDDVLEGLSTAEEPSPEEEAGELPAVRINEFSLSKLSIHFTDTSLATPYHEIVTVDYFDGQDLGTIKKKLKPSSDGTPSYHWDFAGELSTNSGARIALEGGALSIVPWAFELDLNLEGFPIDSVQPYISESIDLQVEGAVSSKLWAKVELNESAIGAEVTVDVSVADFRSEDEVQEYLVFDQLRVSELKANYPENKISLGEIVLHHPEATFTLSESGEPILPRIHNANTLGAEEESGGSSLTPFVAKLQRIAIEQGVIHLKDQSIPGGFASDLSEFSLDLTDVEALQSSEIFDASGALKMGLGLLDGRFSAEAELESLSGVTRFSAQLESLDLSRLQPYLQQHAQMQMDSGKLSFDLAGTLQALTDPAIELDFSITELNTKDLKEGRPLFGVEALQILGMKATPLSAQIEEILIRSPFVEVWQDENGTNLSRITVAETEEARAAEEELETSEGELVAAEETVPFEFQLGAFRVEGGRASFIDTNLVSTHQSTVNDFQVLLENVSTQPDTLSNYTFSAKVDGGALLSGSGKVNAISPQTFLDLDLGFRGYDLTSTSPYWETFLGRGLAKGQFQINSRYTVRDNQLKGTNDFLIDQLTLGEKVSSDRAVNLPLGFAINLMRDPSGEIAYKGLPVEGDLSDPQVKPWGLIGKALRNLILNAVASPFKFLAGMVGGRDDLDTIGFEFASTSLSEEAKEKVAALEQILGSRPGIKIELAPLISLVEREYLEAQYAKLSFVRPDFTVVSGTDLLVDIDQSTFESAVREAYAQLSPETIPQVTEMDLSEDNVDVSEPTKTSNKSGENSGIVKRFSRFLGFGKKADTKPDPIESPSVASVESSTVPTSGQEPAPSLEEMFLAVLSTREAPVFEAKWFDDLSKERMKALKNALLDSGAIDTSRIYSLDSVPDIPSQQDAGGVKVTISE